MSNKRTTTVASQSKQVRANDTRRRKTVAFLSVVVGGLVLVVLASLAVAACSSRGSIAERVGSSSSAVSSITSEDASASAPLFSAQTAAGDTDAGNNATTTSQLTVFQGTFGGTTENGYTQRLPSGTMTAKNGYSNWPHPTVSDGHTLNAYTGPITDAYLNESGKFVVASVVSTSSNTNTDIVLVTTIDGGQTWVSTSTSVACSFVTTSGGTPACPGLSGVKVQALALAVDPVVSPLAGSPFHDVYLYFTTTTTSSGTTRDIWFYEFYVDGNGTVHQEQAGTLASPITQIKALQATGPWTYADTFNMVVGREKSCIGDGGSRTPFIFGVFASTNPYDNGACDTGMTQSTTWTGTYILSPDGGTFSSWTNTWSDNALTNTEPDCIGKQRNWPGVGLAYDDQDTTTTGGGGSVKIIMSRSTSGGFGQRVYTYDSLPLGCVGVGSTCVDCCTIADCGGTNPGYTTPLVCNLNGAIVDCDSTGCGGPKTSCPQVEADAILPQIAYNNHATTPYLSEVWYDNRHGTAKSFGEIRGTSGATQYAAGLSVTTTQVLPYDAEGNTSANTNQCIGFAVRNEDATEYYGASTGAATIYDWQFQN